MKPLKFLAVIAAFTLSLSLVAETKSSKLNPEPKRNVTPAKAHKDSQTVSNGVDDQDVVKSLSPKNKKVYSSLSDDDKKKISDAYKKGKDPHTKMVEILKKDQKNGKNGDSDSGFVWEDSKTPAQQHSIDEKPVTDSPAQKASQS